MAAGFEPLELEALRRRRSAKWRVVPPDVLPAWIAEMDFPLAEPVAAALHEAIELGDCGYAHPGGLAEAFAGFAEDRFGWRLDPARVAMVADVMGGVDHVLALVTRPGDGVVVNPPVYPPFFEHVRQEGRRIVTVPLGRDDRGYRLDLDALEAAFAGGARAWLLCSPHNPTGTVFDPSTLRAAAELAARHRVFVLADEIHAPLTLPGARHTPFAPVAEAAGAEAVSLVSASKAFNLAGLKCALVVSASETVRRRVAALPVSATTAVGLLGVLASVAAFTAGGGWLDELLAYLDGNRTALAALLRERLPTVGYQPPAASYLGWLDCRPLGLGDDPAELFLARGRVALGRGLDFGPGGAGFVRVTMGTSRELLGRIVDGMAAALTAEPVRAGRAGA